MAGNAGVNRVGTKGGITLLTIPPGGASPTAITWPNYGINNGPPQFPQPYGTLQTNLSDESQWGPSTYGTDSGIQMLAAVGFTKWAFQLAGPGANAATTAAFTVSVYGTLSPGILAQTYSNAGNTTGYNYVNPEASLTMIPGYDWFLLPAPSEQAGAGGVTNPLVTSATGSGVLIVSMALVAVRVVLTGAAPTTGTAPLRVLGFAVP
jgi:hypothetical protein